MELLGVLALEPACRSSCDGAGMTRWGSTGTTTGNVIGYVEARELYQSLVVDRAGGRDHDVLREVAAVVELRDLLRLACRRSRTHSR